MPTPRLLLVYGGASSEHEISIRSARSVLDAIDHARWSPVLLAIRRDGGWRTGPLEADLASIAAEGAPVADIRSLAADVVFPVLHGPYGEDGTIQGLLEILGLPYVGSGVLASAVCMDKIVQKQIVAAAAPEIPLVPWQKVDAHHVDDPMRADALAGRIGERLGLPCFVKPANLGSSVGVVKVDRHHEILPALRSAARFDRRIIVEAGVDAREIEVAVLGDGGDDTLVSAPGEIGLPPGVWYDYATKYEKDVATLHIPAELPEAAASRIRMLALAAYRATGCRGLARIDFLYDRASGTPYLNELNTMPGFTSISMYPKLMEHAGVPYRELVTRLCELALSHHAERRTLSNART
jgi:D-alanine--D-alanine ligase